MAGWQVTAYITKFLRKEWLKVVIISHWFKYCLTTIGCVASFHIEWYIWHGFKSTSDGHFTSASRYITRCQHNRLHSCEHKSERWKKDFPKWLSIRTKSKNFFLIKSMLITISYFPSVMNWRKKVTAWSIKQMFFFILGLYKSRIWKISSEGFLSNCDFRVFPLYAHSILCSKPYFKHFI